MLVYSLTFFSNAFLTNPDIVAILEHMKSLIVFILYYFFIFPPHLYASSALNKAPTCKIKFNVPSKQSTSAKINILPDFVNDNGAGIYPGAKFEVDNGSGTGFKRAEKNCDFDTYGPVEWIKWNCIWVLQSTVSLESILLD